MRIERLGERAVILRDLPCEAFVLARQIMEGMWEVGNEGGFNDQSHERNYDVAVDTEFHSESTVPSPCSPLLRGKFDLAALGFEEAVASYETVGLYFSEPVLDLEGVRQGVLAAAMGDSCFPEPKLIEIPVCYELGPDLANAAQTLQMPAEELISRHLETEYRCYAVGFSPGFAYLGYLDDRIASLPRLGSPRPRVEPGSVGITGRQTAVYPSATPGGWNLIGRSPLTLVDVEDSYFSIQAGDRVKFTRIDTAEFARREGQRL